MSERKQEIKRHQVFLLSLISSNNKYLLYFPHSVLSSQSLSRIQLFVTPWAVAHQAFLSMEFSRPKHWGGLLFPPPGGHPNPGTKPKSPALAGRFFGVPPEKPFSLTGLFSVENHSDQKKMVTYITFVSALKEGADLPSLEGDSAVSTKNLIQCGRTAELGGVVLQVKKLKCHLYPLKNFPWHSGSVWYQ